MMPDYKSAPTYEQLRLHYEELLTEYNDISEACTRMDEELQLLYDYLEFIKLQESFEDFRSRAKKVFPDDKPFGQYIIQ